jgi:hypothetical protein
LKLTQGPIGCRPKYSVGAAGIEPQLIESTLQLCDIVADHDVTCGKSQYSVSELPAGLIKAPKCFRSDYSVNSDSTFLLKNSHSIINVSIKSVVDSGITVSN